MYTASADASIRFWEVNDQTGDAMVVAVAQGHSDEVTGLLLYKDLLLSSSNDGTLRLWDKSTADALKCIPVSPAKLLCLALTPSHVVLGGTDRIMYSLSLSSLDYFLLALRPPPPEPSLLKSKAPNFRSDPDAITFKISGDVVARSGVTCIIAATAAMCGCLCNNLLPHCFCVTICSGTAHQLIPCCASGYPSPTAQRQRA